MSRALPALYNGVSQQPPILRSPDQNEAEENTWAELATGVGKRPPSEMVAQIAINIPDDVFVHHINRDATERYVLLISNGNIRLFDHATATQRIVNAPAGLDYINTSGANLRAVTVADFTFIVNTSKTPSLLPVGADIVAQPDYYRSLGRADGGGSVYQYPTNPNPGQFMGELASMEKLPDVASDGDTYRIVGSSSESFASYYVRRSGAVWDETIKAGLQNALDPLTMPHCLVREADGSFTFVPFSWAPRRVGDETSNPAASFVGRAIRDVFFDQNRLAFLVDENTVLSCAGDFGNFWRNTVLDYLDDDVIDVAVTGNSVSVLNYALPFNDGVMLFADQTQFSMTNGENGLTPSSIAIRPATYYEVNTRVRPVTIGTEVYFCGDQGASSVVWEYTRLSDNDATSAAEITAHVPTYVPKGIAQLVAAPNLKALFALTGGTDIYVYQFYWSGNEKVQSSWRRWRMPMPVISAAYLDNHLYLVTRRGNGVFLERIDLSKQPLPRVLLDRQKVSAGVYDSARDRTGFIFNEVLDQANTQIVRGWNHPTRPHSLIDPTGYSWEAENFVTVPGNETGAPVTAGEPYVMRLTFSRQFAQNYRSQPITTGRLQLRTFTVYFADTAFFRTEVSPYGAAVAPGVEPVVAAKLADFTGKVVGDEELRLNRPVYTTGSYSFQVYGEASQATIAISNDTHVQSTFVSAEWEGFYFNRASG
jgi:hypothetical protein